MLCVNVYGMTKCLKPERNPPYRISFRREYDSPLFRKTHSSGNPYFFIVVFPLHDLMIMRMSKTQRQLLYLTSALLSAGIFIGLYGYRIIDSTNTDWLMTGGDLTQHYLGWKAFRLGSWQFPIGLTDNLSYPARSSVIFTDSIPLLSVCFKALSPVLPHEFQFFGLYGLVCFILSGVLSSSILSRWCDRAIPVLICSVFFVTAPVMLFRMYLHTALASQWIILCGLRSIFLYDERFAGRPSRSILLFALLGLFSGSIHIYYAVFSGFILIGFCILDFIRTKHLRTGFLCGAVFIAVFVMTVFLLGGLSYDVSSVSDGLGSYSMNLNSFYNPMGWSSILRDFPVLNAMQEEECLGYLGLGILILSIPALILGLSRTADHLQAQKGQRTALLFVFVSCMVFSLSPVLSFNDRILFQYRLPNLLMRVWAVVRATGRFCWLPVYLVMFAVFIPILQKKRLAPYLLTAGLLVQLYDLSGALLRIHSEYVHPQEYRSLLETGSFWETISEKTAVRHIVFTEPLREEPLYSFTDYALDHNMTVSDYYFARSNTPEVEHNLQESLRNLSEENLYVFPDSSAKPQYPLNYYSIDGFVVGFKEPVPGMDSYRIP